MSTQSQTTEQHVTSQTTKLDALIHVLEDTQTLEEMQTSTDVEKSASDVNEINKITETTEHTDNESSGMQAPYTETESTTSIQTPTPTLLTSSVKIPNETCDSANTSMYKTQHHATYNALPFRSIQRHRVLRYEPQVCNQYNPTYQTLVTRPQLQQIHYPKLVGDISYPVLAPLHSLHTFHHPEVIQYQTSLSEPTLVVRPPFQPTHYPEAIRFNLRNRREYKHAFHPYKHVRRVEYTQQHLYPNTHNDIAYSANMPTMNQPSLRYPYTHSTQLHHQMHDWNTTKLIYCDPQQTSTFNEPQTLFTPLTMRTHSISTNLTTSIPRPRQPINQHNKSILLCTTTASTIPTLAPTTNISTQTTSTLTSTNNTPTHTTTTTNEFTTITSPKPVLTPTTTTSPTTQTSISATEHATTKVTTPMAVAITAEVSTSTTRTTPIITTMSSSINQTTKVTIPVTTSIVTPVSTQSTQTTIANIHTTIQFCNARQHITTEHTKLGQANIQPSATAPDTDINEKQVKEAILFVQPIVTEIKNGISNDGIKNKQLYLEYKKLIEACVQATSEDELLHLIQDKHFNHYMFVFALLDQFDLINHQIRHYYLTEQATPENGKIKYHAKTQVNMQKFDVLNKLKHMLKNMVQYTYFIELLDILHHQLSAIKHTKISLNKIAQKVINLLLQLGGIEQQPEQITYKLPLCDMRHLNEIKVYIECITKLYHIHITPQTLIAIHQLIYVELLDTFILLESTEGE